MMKKIFLTIFLLCAIGLFYGISSSSAQTWTLKLGHVTPKEGTYQLGGEFFAKRVAELTNGRVKVDVYPASMLGDEDDMVEGLQMGTIDMCVSAPAKMSGFVPKVELWGLPFLFRDVEHKNKVVNGPVGDAIIKEIEGRTKIKVLGYWQSGIRYLFNSKKPVKTPDDLAGMKVRVMPGPVEIATWKALGALPTPIAYAELYQALKQGVVDAAENDPANIMGMKFYEPCPYLSTTEHSIAVRYFLMSKKTWEKFPKDIQDLVIKAAKETNEYQVKVDTDMIQKSMDILVSKYGVKVTEVEKKPFLDKTESVRQEMGKKLGVEDLLRQISATK